MARFSAAEIRRYYDRNTAAFLGLGQGGGVGAIHRAVWGPGVRGRDEAFQYVEDRIARFVQRLAPGPRPPHIVDLGCGVGASLCHLAARLPGMTGTGITLSPVQARLADERVRRSGVADRIACLEGDYCDPPPGLEPADLAYAIESFVHGPDPRRFFLACRRLIRTGGFLIICDDFRRPTTDPAAALVIERFCRGWHVNTLLDQDELRALAHETGFEHESTTDLSSWLELNRPRDRAVAALVTLAGWLPLFRARFGHLLGGSALQKGLARGWLGYDCAVFRHVS